ncbi:hypothetical protein [Streptomyces sp. NBC_01198]|uniref:hypothetical protein n=1 Tax=Streptomyces sp. NBC_01198 TaxID=2903769 RepID=UPI002E0ECEFF|nr:hypothetical protein OG702_07915 [Streptomyces sp. NBC_01198]
MHASSVSRRLFGLALLAAVTVSAAGCGSTGGHGQDGQGAAGPSAFATLHGGPSHDQIALPADAYAFDVSERDRALLARAVTIGECLHGFGYPYDLAAEKAENAATVRKDLMDFGRYDNKRRYMVTDPVAAARYGYHLVSTVVGAGGTDGASGLGDLGTAEKRVLYGADEKNAPVTRTRQGKPIPPGGCAATGDEAVAGKSGPFGEATAVASLRSASFQQSREDPEVVAATHAWSACMAARGHTLSDPLGDPGFDIDKPTVSPAESAMAKDDARCKQQTHLVDLWFASEVDYQRRWIASHQADFTAAKADHDETMKRVALVLAAAR